MQLHYRKTIARKHAFVFIVMLLIKPIDSESPTKRHRRTTSKVILEESDDDGEDTFDVNQPSKDLGRYYFVCFY